MVVDDQFDHRDIVTGSCSNLVHVHTEAAVTCNVDDRLILAAHFSANRSAQAVSHGSQSAGSKESSRLTVFIILGSPHLVLSNLGYDHSVPAGHFIYSLDNERTGQYVLVIAQRIHIFHTLNMSDPFVMVDRIQMGI